jgi:Protein of unknown function (DUF3054)
VRESRSGPGRLLAKRHALSHLAVIGDFAAFMLFAALGRGQHGESQGAGEILVTGLPFFAAWLVFAAATGKYRIDRGLSMPRVAKSVALTWLMAWPLALALRATIQHRGIPPSFDIVALLANGVLLSTWRLLLQAVVRLTPKRRV